MTLRTRGRDTCAICGRPVTGRRGSRCHACARAQSRQKNQDAEKNLEALGFHILRERLIGVGIEAEIVDALISAVRNKNSAPCETRDSETRGIESDRDGHEERTPCATGKIFLRLNDVRQTAAS